MLIIFCRNKQNSFGDSNGVISIYQENYPKGKPNDYDKTQTLLVHDGAINVLSRIDENRFISGGVDGKVVVWEEQDKFFLQIDSIKKDRPITALLGLFDSRIVFSSDDNKIYIYKINDSFVNIQKNLCKYIEDEILIFPKLKN